MRKDERYLKRYNTVISRDSSITQEEKLRDLKSLIALTMEYTHYSIDSVRLKLRRHKAFDELLKKAADITDNTLEKELEHAKKQGGAGWYQL